MIPRFYTGQPIRASDLNALADGIRKNEITKVNGGTFQRNSGGTSITLNATASAGGGRAPSYQPFEIIDGYPVEQGGVVIRVSGDSWLTNIESGEKIVITGLGAAPGSPQDNKNDQGQFSLPQVGEYIYLEVSLTDQEITGAEIKSGAIGTEENWTDFPKPVEFTTDTPIKQASKTRVAIAQVHAENADYVSGKSFTTETGEVRIVRQLVTTHLGIQYAIIESCVAPILVPYHAVGKID